MTARRASDEVADQLRAHIASEGLRPGDRLGREEDLARHFGVSRPTVREAIRALSSVHILTATKGRGCGIFVAATPEQGIGRSLTAAVANLLENDTLSIEELLETRMLLEVPLAGLAAQNAGPDDLAALQALITEAGSAEDVLGLDTRLHRTVARIAGNRLAAALTEWIAEALLPPLHAMITPAVVDVVVVEQHRDLLRAIERGDPGAAERAMREHLTYLRDLVDAVRASQLG
jgi:GntR family transcriptional regulator, transcriptional repressor for pyruvate dehydrogenase complex